MKSAEITATERIKQWSMRGADRDLAGRFRSPDDIRALLGAHPGHAREVPEPPEQPLATVIPLLVKRPDEAEWRPLAVDRSDARERL
jgi:hypothetical protein